MSLSDIDRQLLDRCLRNEPHSWEAFIDRFLGLVVHVVNHTTNSRDAKASSAEKEDLVSEIFLTLLNNDCAVLRRFRRQSSLATYLTVIARRVVVHKLKRPRQVPIAPNNGAASPPAEQPVAPQTFEDREEIELLLMRLDPREAEIVRMHHLEGKSYGEISSKLGMPENSVGPTLTRAREKMRTGQAG